MTQDIGYLQFKRVKMYPGCGGDMVYYRRKLNKIYILKFFGFIL